MEVFVSLGLLVVMVIFVVLVVAAAREETAKVRAENQHLLKLCRAYRDRAGKLTKIRDACLKACRTWKDRSRSAEQLVGDLNKARLAEAEKNGELERINEQIKEHYNAKLAGIRERMDAIDYILGPCNANRAA